MKIYHHNDADGRCAAAIVLRYAEIGPIGFGKIETIEVDYKDTIQVDKILANETVVIVDFSFKPEVMEKVLEQTSEIIWIDHHKTAFEYRYSKVIEGIRQVEFSGCELSWMYFRNGKLIPRAVSLIGDYDKWALKFQPECFEFYEGLKLENTTPQSGLWDRLFENHHKTVDRIIEQGKSAIQYRDNYCLNLIKQVGYETHIYAWPSLTAFAANMYYFGSRGFGDLFHRYDLVIAYIHDGRQFQVSLYSEKVDVSEIAKHYGGGGHASAAGFVCKELPFGRIIE